MIAVAEGDVRAAASGDRAAFTRLVERTASVVCAIAFAQVRDVAASEDVAQDVFVKVWRRLPQLRSPASFLPWLRQTTRHTASNHRRQRRPTDELVEELPDPGPDASAALVTAEERALVAEAIASLPDETREVVTLFYREGESVAQVAALLDLSVDAVKQRLSRARARLRTDLAARLGRVLRDSAPGSTFGAVVAAGVASSGGVAKASSLPVVVAGAAKVAGFSTVIAAVGGALGVLFGYWYYRRLCADDVERRTLARLSIFNLALVVILLFAMGPIYRYAPVWGEAGLLVAFLGGMAWINLVALPRALSGMRRIDWMLNLAGLVAGLGVVAVMVVQALF